MNGDSGGRDPRIMADNLPDRALIVALVYAEEHGDDSAAAADSLAMELGRHREHTLLTSAASDLSPLDLLLGGAEGEGLPGALEGRARLTDIAIQPVDRPFVYLPAGRRPQHMAGLLNGDLFASFVERIREREGTLLLLLPELQLADARVRDLLDGYVALGDAVADAPPDLPMCGRLQVSAHEEATASAVEAPTTDDEPVDVAEEEPQEPAEEPQEPADALRGPGRSFEFAPVAGEGEEIDRDAVPEEDVEGSSNAIVDADTSDSRTPSWRRHRAQTGFPARRVAIGAGAIAVLIVGWWLIGNAMRGPVGAEAEPTMSAPASSGDGTEAVEPEPVTPALSAADAEAAAGLAPELPYSVLVASYAARSDAEDRLARLRRGPGGPYFVVPTLIRGALYHRVFAGAQPDAESARTLMTELVESGRKDDASAWHIRPARLAYLLGAYGTRPEANARRETVVAAGVPAYTLSAALEGGLGPDSVFQVYAGAYETPVAARALIPLLESAGEDAELVSRRGRRP
jgi:hypothetical protein